MNNVSRSNITYGSLTKMLIDNTEIGRYNVIMFAYSTLENIYAQIKMLS